MTKQMKKPAARLTAILLSLMMVVVFMPTFAFAADGDDANYTQIAVEQCTKIGVVEDLDDSDMYYINIGDADTTVQFTDFGEATFTALGSFGGMDGGTNVVNLKKGYGYTFDELKEHYGDGLDLEACEGLDFSNIYGVFGMDDETYDSYVFIIQGPSIDFTFNKGQLTEYVKDGLGYKDTWSAYPEVLDKTMDLYKVALPTGLTSVELSFTKDRLAYAYDENGEFIAACGAEGDGTYASGGQVGQKKAIVKALEDGSMPKYVYIQTPYTEDWQSVNLFAISFEFYTFTASYEGNELTNMIYTPNDYKCLDMMGENQIAGVYTIVIPDGAEKIDFTMSGPVLHYNYKEDGTYIGGWVEDATHGDTVFEQTVDCPTSMEEADGIPDFIQMQIPYDASWNSLLLFAVTFVHESDIALEKAKVSVKPTSYTYTGKAKKPAVTVSLQNGRVLKEGRDYSVKYSNNKNAGKGKVTITGEGVFTGSKDKTFTINKAKQPLKVTAKASKTYKVKALKKSKKTYKAITVSKNVGKVSYKVTYKTAKAQKALSFSKGKVTVKKGTKKGTYKMTVKVTAKATKNYKVRTITKNIKVVVK